MQNQLFKTCENTQCPLTKTQRNTLAAEITEKAKLKAQYFYTIKETCAILKISYSAILRRINLYKLDVVMFRNVMRIPWYDLTAFILTDAEDTLEQDYYEYFNKKAK